MGSFSMEGGASGKEAPVEGSVIEREPSHKDVKLERNFSFLSCLGLAFAVLNTWTAMSASLSVVLPSGGSIAMVWGLVVSSIGTLAMTLSMAEICHVLPLSGGQYDWSYILAPPGWKNGISFITGWNSTAAWISLAACASSLGSNFILGLISLWHPSYKRERWHSFLVYLAFTFVAFVLNVFAIRLLPVINRVAGSWSIVGIVVVIVVLLVCARGDYQPAKIAFAKWTNETGWPDGMAFILGLLQSTFGLTAFDGVSQLIEEMPRPAINAPKTMVLALIMGAVTSWVFMVVLLFCLSDYDKVLADATGPLLQIYYQATASRSGATCLLIFNLGAMFFAAQGLTTVSSRLLLTFARDRGIGQLSRFLAPVHPKLRVPVWCIVFTTVWVTIFGLINLGSSVALHAVLSSCVVFFQTSYFIPIALVFCRGTRAFEGYETACRWTLGIYRRWINGAALIFLVVTTVAFLFPPRVPVRSGTMMNWVVVVDAIVWVMAGITWIIDGRKRYLGPSRLHERLMMAREA